MSSSSKLLVYKASAGSGKTFTLAVEYIKLLIQNPRNYRHILAVTFTNKATTEMKERILGQLHGIAIGDKDSEAYLQNICQGLDMRQDEVRVAAGKALQYIIHDYSRFRVETIDSFFQSIIRNLARELELNSSMNLELNSGEVLSDAVDSMIEKLNRNSPVLRWLLDYIEERIQNDRRWNVSGEIKQFGSNIFDETYIEKGKGLRDKLKDKDCIKNYRTLLKGYEESALTEMKKYPEAFRRQLETIGITPLELKSGARGISGYFNKIDDGNLSDKIRTATVEKHLVDENEWASKTSPHRLAIVDLAHRELIPLLEECERKRMENNVIVNSCRLSLKHVNNLRLLVNIDEEVRLLNKEQNRFLLADTNALLHSLVQEGDSSFVFEKIGSSIRNIMIDEFQDTSRMQWSNFKLLLLEGLAQGQDSLIVGDVKQSIYRWRNGDWRILNELNDRISVFPIDVKTLKINRRSQSRVIRFNNGIFTAACDYLNSIYRAETENECVDLRRAYNDVCQESPRKEEKGYVKVSFLDDDEGDGPESKSYAEKTLHCLAGEVVRLVEGGVKQTDITILVRKNKSIPQIADYFEKQLPYRIVSDEAFRLDASLAVCMLIDALRYLANPDDKIPRARLAAAWQREVHKKPLDVNVLLIGNVNDYLPEEFINHLTYLRSLPLYELLEKLYRLFDMNLIAEQDSYLFSFFDAVMEYMKNRPSDLDAFIEYWDGKLSGKTIPTGDLEGIRIMSIHKSKGLEFHTVLLPFCDWKLENETNNQLVWCAPRQRPFSDLDLVPVNYSSAMAQSVYQAEYMEERLQLWVDNLNLLYVALTRAGHNLIIWSKDNQGGTISELLYNSLDQLASTEGLEWNPEEPYEYGTLCPSEEKTVKETTNRLLTPSQGLTVRMESFAHQVEFKQSNRSARFISGEEEETTGDKYINQGQLLHSLFSVIATTADIDRAIERLTFEGLIDSRKQAEQLRKLAEFALSHPRVAEWYSGRYSLFRECAIIYKENGVLQTRIPDRVMMSEGEVIVVDFKFGKPKKEYQAQVREYMNLLVRMGHHAVKGYLWYVFDNKIEEVE